MGTFESACFCDDRETDFVLNGVKLFTFTQIQSHFAKENLKVNVDARTQLNSTQLGCCCFSHDATKINSISYARIAS